MTRTLELTKNLIARKSNTPDDAGCQDLLVSLLEPLGFKCEKIKVGDVENLYARKGTEAPFFVFAGHTDVVPSGPVDQWISPPFEPTIKDDKLYGRGAADMKTSIAAFIVSIEEFKQGIVHLIIENMFTGKKEVHVLTDNDCLDLKPHHK